MTSNNWLNSLPATIAALVTLPAVLACGQTECAPGVASCDSVTLTLTSKYQNQYADVLSEEGQWRFIITVTGGSVSQFTVHIRENRLVQGATGGIVWKMGVLKNLPAGTVLVIDTGCVIPKACKDQGLLATGGTGCNGEVNLQVNEGDTGTDALVVYAASTGKGKGVVTVEVLYPSEWTPCN